MSQQKQRFVELLEELFQLNQPELDFGLYRILHARSQEIRAFMNGELATEIDQAFAGQAVQSAHELLQAAKQKVLDDLADDAFDTVGELKPEYRNTKIGKDYLQAQQAAREGSGPLSDQAQVYDHLYRFFSRYYDKGDFMSKRYFVAENDQRAAPYAVPYDGREVMLHWANKDQYYIKSSEHLSNYSFDLTEALRLEAQRQGKGQELDFGGEAGLGPMKVHFRLAAATEGEHNNVKESQDRFFLIHAAEPIKFEAGSQGQVELVVHFEYRPDHERPPKTHKDTWQQQRLVEAAVAVLQALQTATPSEAKAQAYARGLTSLSPTEKRPDRSVLTKYMAQFADRNTMDYFIHKDLGGFLRRELDFYIKNEVMRLDDIESAQAPRVEAYLGKLRVLRKIGRRIVDFLAQLEDFQKKLWLKKKFVVDTQYCVALRNVPEGLLAEVAANDAQRAEWVALCKLDQQQSDLTKPAYSVPLSVAFLKAQPTLMLDTRHFDAAFKERLVAALDDLDDIVDGVLVHSDNFQALNLMQAKYRSQVKTIAIDPPYNRQGDGFPYKDNYKHSSWASMMQDRLQLAWNLLNGEGALFSNIDENERDALSAVLDATFGKENRIEELIWAQNTTHSQSPLYSTNHEYVEVYAKDRAAAERSPAMFREPKPGLRELNEIVNELNRRFAGISEIEQAIRGLYEKHLIEFKNELAEMGLNYNEETKKQDPWRGLYNYVGVEYRDAAGNLVAAENARDAAARICVFRESDPSAPAQKQSDTTKDPEDPNYRFYKPIHPVTGRPCAIPKRGWAWPKSWPDGGRESFDQHVAAGRIIWGADEAKIPQYKRFVHEVETNVAKSFFHDYTDGEKQIAALFGEQGLFPTPKPTTLPAKFIAQTTGHHCRVVDFFGGSGTTGHSVISLNRETGSRRKFVLVEMSDYFDRILLNRLKKVAFAAEWADGHPKPMLSPDDIERSPRAFKVLRVESFEDTLNNLTLQAAEPMAVVGQSVPESLKREYLLKYWLSFETANSPSLLNVQQFTDPTAYVLTIKQPGTDAQVQKCVDLVETFNWLIGLHVTLLDKPRQYAIDLRQETDPELPDDQGTRWVHTDIDEVDTGEFWFRMVEGHVFAVPGDELSRERVLVIWRKLSGDAGRDQAALEAWLSKMKINPRDTDFATIYVNGSHALNTDGSAGTRVCMIEETFAQRMWEDC